MANESLFAFIEYNDDIEDNVGKLLELGTAPQKIISGLEILKILKEITRNSNVINVIEDKLLNIIYEVTPSIFRPNKTNIDLLLSDEDKFIALHGMEEKVQSFNHESKAYKALFFLPQIERNPEILQTRRTELLSYPLQLPTNTLEPAKIQTFHNKALVNLIISFTSSQDSKALYLTGKSETDKHLLQEHDSSSLLGYQDEESEVG